MFKKSCCKAKELSVSFQRVSNIQLYIYIFNLHLIDGHVYTHIYKIDDTEKKRKEKASKLKTVGRTLFRKENIAEVCYSNKYIYTYIYGIFTGMREFSRYIYMYMTITVYTHDLIFGNIYAVFEIVNELILPFIFYLN